MGTSHFGDTQTDKGIAIFIPSIVIIGLELNVFHINFNAMFIIITITLMNNPSFTKSDLWDSI